MSLASLGPVIAAIREESELEQAINSPVKTIFLLSSDLINSKRVVQMVQGEGKQIFLHVDLVRGLGSDPEAIRYIAREIKPDGIISTKTQAVMAAKVEGLPSIQRVFALDSQALAKLTRSISAVEPDAIEILPGLLPKVIMDLKKKFSIPVITGGLISEEDEVEILLKVGASGISTSSSKLWNWTR